MKRTTFSTGAIAMALACASSLVSGIAPSLAQSWNGKGADPYMPAAPKASPTVTPLAAGGNSDAPKAGGGAGGGAGGVYFYSEAGDLDGDDATVNPPTTPELHVVKRGDTLWDICWYYFGDPWQWPKVWSYNAQITNPHWIYPGNLVRLLPRGMVAASAGPTPDVAAAAPGNERARLAPEDTRTLPAKTFSVQLRQHAFVDQDNIDTSVRITGSVDEKGLLSEGDSVYLSYDERNPPKTGERYSIYVPGETVKSKGATVGAYVRILGTLEVVNVKKDKRARGVIVEAHEEIERGARVGELKQQLTTAAAVPAKVDAQGTIVALVTRNQLIGQGEVVFIDLGEKSGIAVGNRMFVIRRGDALIPRMGPGEAVGQNDKRFPARAVGEIVVVDVGKRVSIGLVTLAVKEMGVGDTVLMQAAD